MAEWIRNGWWLITDGWSGFLPYVLFTTGGVVLTLTLVASAACLFQVVIVVVMIIISALSLSSRWSSFVPEGQVKSMWARIWFADNLVTHGQKDRQNQSLRTAPFIYWIISCYDIFILWIISCFHIYWLSCYNVLMITYLAPQHAAQEWNDALQLWSRPEKR